MNKILLKLVVALIGISVVISTMKDNVYEDKNQNQTAQVEVNSDKYYVSIKEALEKQQYYINSIDDPSVKQSLQTPNSSAIMEADRLIMQNPEDEAIINSSLKIVLTEAQY